MVKIAPTYHHRLLDDRGDALPPSQSVRLLCVPDLFTLIRSRHLRTYHGTVVCGVLIPAWITRVNYDKSQLGATFCIVKLTDRLL